MMGYVRYALLCLGVGMLPVAGALWVAWLDDRREARKRNDAWLAWVDRAVRLANEEPGSE